MGAGQTGPTTHSRIPQLSAGYHGQTYYFCSEVDRDEFKKNPQKYVK
ncbi:MAG: YHS domain-containing protein [Acidobacteria bacterium]|nr:MAG: YHS domain-containing protein [Acidobacteriota bacterium]